MVLAKEDEIEVPGRVTEVCRGGNFRVDIELGESTSEVFVRLSGKMRKNSIKVVPGDKVRVALSPYDLSKGRIIYREKF